MNDFTKEELEIISGSLYFTLLHKHSEMTANTRKKIQSMLDNYCECTGKDEFTDTVVKCIKCSKIKFLPGYSDDE